MKADRIELYYVSIPLEKRNPGFFSQPAYFDPSWIPGFRQSEMRVFLLKLGTDQGYEGYAAMAAMGPERKGVGPMMGNYLMDPGWGLKQAMYLKDKKNEQYERTAKAQFAVPEPLF